MTPIKEKLLHRLLLLLGVIVLMNFFFVSVNTNNLTGYVTGINGNLSLTISLQNETNYDNETIHFLATLQDESNNSIDGTCFFLRDTTLSKMTKEGTNYLFSTILASGNHTWAVSCITNDNAINVNSSVEVLSSIVPLENNKTPVIQILSPEKDAHLLKNATFSWNVENATQLSGEIILSEDPSFTNAHKIGLDGNQNNYSANIFLDKKYYWKLHLQTEKGILESEVYSFETNKKPKLENIHIDGGINTTKDMITASADITDPENDKTKIVYNWKVKEKSMYLLYLPIEGEYLLKDHSGNNRDGTVFGSIQEIPAQDEFRGIQLTDGVIALPDLGKQTFFTLRMNVKSEGDTHLFSSEELFFEIVNNSLLVSIEEDLTFSVPLTSDWQTITFVKNTTNARIFLNSKLINEKQAYKSIKLNNMKIGEGKNTSLDDIRIYNRALSSEQIGSKENMIVPSELQNEETWSAELISFDKYQEGDSEETPSIYIVNQNISISVISPEEEFVFFNKTILFNWTLNPLLKNKSIQYWINISETKEFTNPTLISAASPEHIFTSEKAGKYYWNIIAKYNEQQVSSITRSFSVINLLGCSVSKDQLTISELLAEEGIQIELSNTKNTDLSVFASTLENLTGYQIKIENGNFTDAQKEWINVSKKEKIITNFAAHGKAEIRIKAKPENGKGLEKTTLNLYCQ